MLLLPMRMVAMVFIGIIRQNLMASMMDITIGIVRRNLQNMIVQKAPFQPARKTNLGIINVIVRRDLLCIKRTIL